MTMREKMARAIGDALFGDADPATCPNNFARALAAVDPALGALMDPTEGMEAALKGRPCPTGRDGYRMGLQAARDGK